MKNENKIMSLVMKMNQIREELNDALVQELKEWEELLAEVYDEVSLGEGLKSDLDPIKTKIEEIKKAIKSNKKLSAISKEVKEIALI